MSVASCGPWWAASASAVSGRRTRESASGATKGKPVARRSRQTRTKRVRMMWRTWPARTGSAAVAVRSSEWLSRPAPGPQPLGEPQRLGARADEVEVAALRGREAQRRAGEMQRVGPGVAVVAAREDDAGRVRRRQPALEPAETAEDGRRLGLAGVDRGAHPERGPDPAQERDVAFRHGSTRPE